MLRKLTPSVRGIKELDWGMRLNDALKKIGPPSAETTESTGKQLQLFFLDCKLLERQATLSLNFSDGVLRSLTYSFVLSSGLSCEEFELFVRNLVTDITGECGAPTHSDGGLLDDWLLTVTWSSEELAASLEASRSESEPSDDSAFSVVVTVTPNDREVEPRGVLF